MQFRLAARRTVLLACTLVALVATAPAGAVPIEEVLAGFDRVQESIRTLSAEFTETTRSALLKEAIVARGKVFLTKPDSVRWEYSVPEEMRFVIANDQYTGYFPTRGQAEQRDVRRWGEQLFRFLGIGQASGELAKFYDISIGEGSNEREILLILDPKRKRVRKRMESVRFWVDTETYLPRRVQYSGHNGSTRLVEFERVAVNPEIAASLYQVELPADVQVTKGFSALSGFGSGSTDN